MRGVGWSKLVMKVCWTCQRPIFLNPRHPSLYLGSILSLAWCAKHEMFSHIYALVTFTHAIIVVDENGWWINEFTSIYKLAEFHGTTHTGGHHPPPSDRWEYWGVSELGGVSDDDEWSCLWFERGIGHISIDSHTQYAFIINWLPHIHACTDLYINIRRYIIHNIHTHL